MTPSNKATDHHFSSFAMGATIGIIAALLFGTEEGRKVVKKVLDSIPEKYKKIPDNLIHQDKPELPRTPIIIPEETPHHSTYDFHSTEVLGPNVSLGEVPPPAPPSVRPFRPI